MTIIREQHRVRPFEDRDTSAIDKVFRVTADSGLQASPDPRTLTYGSHIWCHPYTYLNPSDAFMLVDDSDKAIGYILSTPDTALFSHRYAAEYLPTLSADITTPLPPDTDTTWRPDNLPNALLDKIQHAERWPRDIEAEVPGVLARFPAHIHIDILPEYQRKGFGKVLMQTCLRNLRAKGVKGVHLQMVEGNVAARAFYKATGWRQWSDDGKGEWCMVIEL